MAGNAGTLPYLQASRAEAGQSGKQTGRLGQAHLKIAQEI
jgi:hypothetical protein